MGHREEFRHLPAQHRKAAAAGLAHLVGTTPARGRRADPGPCGAGGVLLSQGRDPEVPDVFDAVQRLSSYGEPAGYTAEHRGGEPGVPRAEASGPPGKLPAAYAPTGQGDGAGGDSAGWRPADAEL